MHVQWTCSNCKKVKIKRQINYLKIAGMENQGKVIMVLLTKCVASSEREKESEL